MTVSTFPRVIRPPAVSDVTKTLFQVKEKAEPELIDLLERELDEKVDWQLLVSIHIQDGVVNHIKVAGKTVRDMDATGWIELKKLSAADMLKSGLVGLRGTLISCLVAGYHGHVVMQFSRTGEKRLFSCEAEQVYRVQSGRVPT